MNPVDEAAEGAPVSVRIQRRRTKGWRMPEGAVYVGRPGRFGNPFIEAEMFDEWLIDGSDPHRSFEGARYMRELRAGIKAGLPELRGKDLACWCPLDKPCHADVLLRLANA